MANLLPIKERRTLQRDQLLRLSTLVLVVLGAAGFVSALSFTAAYVMAGVEERTLASHIETLKDTLEARQEGVERDVLARARRHTAAVIQTADSSPSVGTAVEAVADVRPDGVRVTRMEYAEAGDSGTLRVTGTVLRQETLSDFARALRSVPIFSAVEVPISAFANIERGGFTITIRGAF